MCEDYDPDPDQPSDHPDAPVPPFGDEEEESLKPEIKMRRPSGNPRVYWR